MNTTLKTKRLTLRLLSLSDQDAMVDTIMSDMDVMYWLPYSDQVSTFEGQREVAYAIRKSMWGKGFVTEALTACLDWIFIKPEIFCVHAVTDNENTASQRVMEKLGMKHSKDVDLYDSVAKGEGLLPFYSIEREVYLGKNGTEVKN